MTAPWLEIFAADALGAHRNLRQRMAKNVPYTVWFFVLVIFAFGTIVWLIAFIANSGDVLVFPLAVNDVLFLYFMAFMGKALLDHYHLLVERPASVFLVAQPMRQRSIVAGKLLSVSAFNLSLLAFGLGLITALTFLGEGMHFVIPPYIVADAIVLNLLASSVGFIYAVLSGLAGWWRKLAGAAAFSPVVSAVWLFTLQLRWDEWQLTMAYLAIYAVTLAILPVSSAYLLEAWNTMTSSKATSHLARRKLRGSILSRPISRFLGGGTLAVFEKEMRTLLRRREGVGNAITLIGFVAFAFYFFTQLDEIFQLTGIVLTLMPAIVVGLSLFLAAMMLCVIPALGAFSKDGKASWVLKSAPSGEDEVAQGKALASFVMAPFIVLAVAVPLPLLTGSSPYALLFSVLGAVGMCAAGTGIGIWLGARYPNFDEAAGNSPDVMTMYMVMLLCLVAFGLLFIPPLLVAIQDQVLGLLAMAFAVDACFLVLYAGTQGAATSFGRMELAQ
jgi:hypothetical protein